jgi:lysozyme
MSRTTQTPPGPKPRVSPKAKKGSLAAIVGIGAAVALGFFIPREESGRTVEASIAQDGTLAIDHVRGRQYLAVYLDMVGVATACDGITTLNGKPMRLGMNFTEEECGGLLEHELAKHAKGVMDCTPGLALSKNAHLEKLREGPRFAAVSLAYNVGVRGYCGSTARKRFNAGEFAAGCTALTWWNKAGGRVVRGLVNRRAKEAKVCREGLGALRSVL